MKTCTLILFCLLAVVCAATDKIFVGYYPSWTASGQPDGCNLSPEKIPAQRYTHLIWSFASFQPSDGSLDPLPNADVAKFIGLKQQNHNLKFLAAVGGAAVGEDVWHQLVINRTSVLHFAKSSVTWLRSYGLDGLDIDWEYPADSYPAEAPFVVPFFRAIRDAFQAEVLTHGRSRLLLTSAAPAGEWALDGYQPTQLQHLVDWFNVMLYDFYGTWSSTTGPLAALHGDATVDLDDISCLGDFLRRNVSKDKLVFGFPNYAATWTVYGPNGLYAPVNGTGGNPGICGNSGQLTAVELKHVLNHNAANIHWDSASQTPYLQYGNQFASFENARSIDLKLQYLLNHGYPGAMMWSISPNTEVSDQIWTTLSIWNHHHRK